MAIGAWSVEDGSDCLAHAKTSRKVLPQISARVAIDSCQTILSRSANTKAGSEITTPSVRYGTSPRDLLKSVSGGTSKRSDPVNSPNMSSSLRLGAPDLGPEAAGWDGGGTALLKSMRAPRPEP